MPRKSEADSIPIKQSSCQTYDGFLQVVLSKMLRRSPVPPYPEHFGAGAFPIKPKDFPIKPKDFWPADLPHITGSGVPRTGLRLLPPLQNRRAASGNSHRMAVGGSYLTIDAFRSRWCILVDLEMNVVEEC
jgi:hypothetical protein